LEMETMVNGYGRVNDSSLIVIRPPRSAIV
jgi:hypothetical protein